jgi:HEAT repeat protein
VSVRGALPWLLATSIAGSAQGAPPPTAPARESLRDRTGISLSERELRGTDPTAHERAIVRLGALGTPRAVELLVKALEPNGLAQTAPERLLAVRALAPRAREPRVRDCLLRVMTSISAGAERADPLQALLRDTAALALSASGEEGALAGLSRALRQPGRVAQAARNALVAHPPADLARLVRAHGTPTLELVRLLAELDDERGYELLREVIERGGAELRTEAASALTRLGNFDSVELSRRFSKPAADPAQALSAAEILVRAHDPDAASLVARLLGSVETRERALFLAHKLGDPALDPALVALLSGGDSSQLPAVLAALSQSASSEACDALERAAGAPKTAALAFQALSRAPGERARAVLERLLSKPESRRAAARAGILRGAWLGDPPRGLDARLEALAGSKLAADRAVAGFGLALRHPGQARELVALDDPELAEGAARAAPFVGAAVAAADRLAREPSGRLRTQLALSLVDARARARVPTSVLIALIEEQGPATPIALFALAERDSEDTRARLLDQLASPDPLLRAQVALGLGGSDDATALGLLESAYRFELDAKVRHALVHALSRRTQPVRRRGLSLAARLDPDRATRSLAALALAGVRPGTFAAGTGILTATLERGDGAARGAVVTAPGGLGLPVLADPDGELALSGLPNGSVDVRVALLLAGGKSPGPGTP